MAVMLGMIAGFHMPVCGVIGQDMDEDLVVVPQLCLESLYCP